MNPALSQHLATLGLGRVPFPPTPDAEAWFQTPSLERELVETAHCLRTRAGFVLLTGEVGTGKSTFLRRLLQVLDADGVVVSLVFNTFLQGGDLLAAVLRDFGLAPQGNPAADIEALNRFLVQRWQAHTPCVLVIDDAQNLTFESLELLRLLTNLETGQEKLLQIVLAGQPELRETLDQPRIRQLTSRICKHVRLSPMDAGQAQRYVDFRLAVAGAAGRIRLDDTGAAALHAASDGNARRIHLIMDRCLYGLYHAPEGRRVIGASLVRRAAAESGAQPVRRAAPRRGWAVAASLGLALGAGMIGLALHSPVPQAEAAEPRISTPPATMPAAADTAAVAAASASGWERCLQGLAGRPTHLQQVNAGLAARIAARGDVCLREEAGHWTAAWSAPIAAQDFLPLAGRDDLVRGLQSTLLRHGDYDGQLDGLYGPRMHAAIARFQQRNGLAATGSPDAATLLLLDTLTASTDGAAPRTDTRHQAHGNG